MGRRMKKIELSKEERNEFLTRFSEPELGFVCIASTVTDKKPDTRKNEISIREIGIKVKLKIYEDRFEFWIKNTIRSEKLNDIRQSLLERGYKWDEKGFKVVHNFDPVINAEEGGIVEEIIKRVKEPYRTLLEMLQDIGFYKERVDIRQAQIQLDESTLKEIAALRKSLVFAMSKGSHELFHTNIWAWLIEKDESFCKVFLGELEGKFECVKREEGNRDLTIWMKKDGSRKAYVVENKFKSIPRADQLTAYQEGLGESFAGGLLVSVKKPTSEFKVDGWGLTTQEKILKKIELVLEKSKSLNDTERQIIAEYIKMTRGLSSIVVDYSSNLDKRWPLAGTVNLFEDIKLGDVFQKMKAAEFVDYIEDQERTSKLREKIKELSEKKYPRGVDGNETRLILEISSGFSHKQCLVDFRVVKQKIKDGEWKEESGIGIQLQGGAFNRCVYTYADGFTASKIDAKFKELWLEDNEFLQDGLSVNKQICGYTTKDYVFRYRGVALTSDEFKDIYTQMITTMELLLSRIKDGDIPLL